MHWMLTFLLYTVLFWGANIALGKFMLFAVAPHGMFDILFNWQDRLNNMWASNNKIVKLLEKMLGGCEVCLLHLVTIFTYCMYVVFANKLGKVWVSDSVNGTFWIIIINIIWYIVFVSIGWWISLNINLRYEKTKEA